LTSFIAHNFDQEDDLTFAISNNCLQLFLVFFSAPKASNRLKRTGIVAKTSKNTSQQAAILDIIKK